MDRDKQRLNDIIEAIKYIQEFVEDKSFNIPQLQKTINSVLSERYES